MKPMLNELKRYKIKQYVHRSVQRWNWLQINYRLANCLHTMA